MIDTKFVLNTCIDCGTEVVTLDEHYALPKCYDFIVVCPNHPELVIFDLSPEELACIAVQELDN